MRACQSKTRILEVVLEFAGGVSLLSQVPRRYWLESLHRQSQGSCRQLRKASRSEPTRQYSRNTACNLLFSCNRYMGSKARMFPPQRQDCWGHYSPTQGTEGIKQDLQTKVLPMPFFTWKRNQENSILCRLQKHTIRTRVWSSQRIRSAGSVRVKVLTQRRTSLSREQPCEDNDSEADRYIK